MAELDPQLNPDDEMPEAETVMIEAAEMPAFIPPNRPRKVYGGMWGPLEIGAVALGLLALVGAIGIYFGLVLPSNRELARNRSEADRLEAEVVSAKTKYGEITTTQEQVDKIVTSVDDFEARFLPVTTVGRTALYQRINGLIAAYGLVNTAGPDYQPLETADMNTGQQSDEERGRAKFRSLYPGMYITTTVEGSYQNLRRFIREIETGREFVIVSAVELAPSDTESDKEKAQPAAQPVQPGAPAAKNIQARINTTMGGQSMVPQAPVQPEQRSKKGKMHGEIVSLRIEMAAYFRRPNAAPVEPTQQQ
ncbi:MAG: hypothetical protein IPM59_05305 [Chloracidobacterium sp.]|nr:hypothetical protein [Chloracidobacterium sp.]